MKKSKTSLGRISRSNTHKNISDKSLSKTGKGTSKKVYLAFK
ncbi:MAG: hypothetical protein ACEQSR_11555 [Candidatus Methylacidiphilales bacterium]